jgi:hypothetical protein
MQFHELEELTQRANKRKKETKPNPTRTIVIDRPLLEKIT